MSNAPYIGRFAPSPSGPLHLGSLMSATASYLQAKSNQGKWLVRIEDVDTPRIVKGMADVQLKQLEQFGFEWDEPVLYQSTRINDYNEIINQLIKNQAIYACECTRKQLKQQALTSETGLIYPQNCRHKNLTIKQQALRLKTDNKQIAFNDTVFGTKNYNIQQLSSDWVIRRVDGIIAYHLAVVADDKLQGITEVVRGVDIMPLTALHIELQHLLEYPTPNYLHHALITENDKKLSKQNHADKVNEDNKVKTLNLILKALRQQEITDCADLNEFWEIAISAWDVKQLTTDNINLISLNASRT